MSDLEGLKKSIEAGEEAFFAGDFAKARECYLAELKRHPDDADLLHALSLVEFRDGQFEQAEEYLQKAISLNRYGVGFQNSLGDLYLAQNKLREAEAAYFEELRMRPDFSLSHNQLGLLMLQTGNVSRAIKHFQSAVQFMPAYAEAAGNLGLALYRDEQFLAAVKAFELALELNDKNARCHANLGHVRLQLGDTTQAASGFERALVLDPNCAEAIRGMAQLRLVQGKVQESIAAFDKVLQLNPADVESVLALAGIWERQGLWEPAEEHYRRAHELAPGNLNVLNQLARLQVARGRNKQAVISYEKALQLRPSDQPSLAGYGNLKAAMGDTKLAMSKLSAVVHSGRATSELISAFARLLAAAGRRRDGITLLEQRLRTRIPKPEKCDLHFALGDLLDADSSYDLAFHNYRQANQHKGARFDANRFTRVCTRIQETFTRQSMDAAGSVGGSGEGFVFMVGMPRAGIRVIEQQLQSHDEIIGTGGTPFIEMSAYRLCSEQGLTWPADASALDQTVLAKYASLFRDRARLLGDETHVLLDATWRNFLYLGLIELMFPRAKIVYCARDFRDVALSCFFTHFPAQAGSTAFAYNLSDIATYINAHRRLMAHWKKTLSLPVHIVSYERMILDYDEASSELLEFLGVPDSRALQDQGSKEDALPKPSSLKSISLRRYRHYKQHLDGLLSELELPPETTY